MLEFKIRKKHARVGSLIAWVFLLFLSSATPAQSVESLPGTKPLTMQGDLSFEMLERVDRFLLQMIDRSVSERQRLWNRDYTSSAAYRRSIAPNRKRFRRYIGVVDERVPFEDLEYTYTTINIALN